MLLNNNLKSFSTVFQNDLVMSLKENQDICFSQFFQAPSGLIVCCYISMCIPHIFCMGYNWRLCSGLSKIFTLTSRFYMFNNSDVYLGLLFFWKTKITKQVKFYYHVLHIFFQYGSLFSFLDVSFDPHKFPK